MNLDNKQPGDGLLMPLPTEGEPRVTIKPVPLYMHDLYLVMFHEHYYGRNQSQITTVLNVSRDFIFAWIYSRNAFHAF